MGLLLFICIAALIVVVIVFVGAPLLGTRRALGEAELPTRLSASRSAREELETAREAKYREIRDAELDFRTGKLSEQDYAAIDSDLRGEALLILHALERAGAEIRPSPRRPS